MKGKIEELWLEYRSHTNSEDAWQFKEWLIKQQEQDKDKYSEEDLKEAFIEGYKQRAEKSNLIFDNASIMYAIHLFEQFKKK